MLLYFYKLLLYSCCNILNQNFAFLVGFGAGSLGGVARLVVNHVNNIKSSNRINYDLVV